MRKISLLRFDQRSVAHDAHEGQASARIAHRLAKSGYGGFRFLSDIEHKREPLWRNRSSQSAGLNTTHLGSRGYDARLDLLGLGRPVDRDEHDWLVLGNGGV